MADSAPIPHPGTWSVRRLCEFTLKIGSGATPTGGETSYLSQRQHWALVRSQNVFDRRFAEEGLAYISDEQAARLSGVQIQPRDILLNITGDGITFGRACEAPASILPAVVNQHVSIVRVDQNVADPGFVLAYLSHPSVKHYIESFNAGGSRRAITKGHIESFRVPLAPLVEQRAIANILGTLDDKIELNRRMNETLEAMARAIFKSWFVDFDPVRAKAEDRDPGLPQPLADLFPDSFEDSELGEIPEGWRVGNVGEFATLSRDGINPGEFPNDTFDHFSIPAFDEGRKPKSELGSTIKSNKFIVPPDAVLLSKLNPRIPRLWLPFVRDKHRAICSTEFLVTLPRTGISREFLYSFLSSEVFADVFETLVTGTSGSHQRVKPEGLLAMNVVIPSEPVIHQFTTVMQPLLARVDRAHDESTTLAALRDTLLPKLISGELRVKDAERIAENVA